MLLPVRIAADTLPALVVGGVLLCVAVAMGLKQWWAHRQLVLNPKIDETGYDHTERQIRRRLVVSGLLFLLGVLIPLGDQLDWFFRARPGLFFGYWIGVLSIVFVMVLMALGDLLSTLAYTQITRVRLRLERRVIEEEIRRYRAGQNGHGRNESDES
jgi:hypothetical protein